MSRMLAKRETRDLRWIPHFDRLRMADPDFHTSPALKGDTPLHLGRPRSGQILLLSDRGDKRNQGRRDTEPAGHKDGRGLIMTLQ